MGSADDFIARTDELQDRVGRGLLRGAVGFGQDLANYAIPQHRAFWENYYNPVKREHEGFHTMDQPRSHYLSVPLDVSAMDLYQGIADRILEDGGTEAMNDAVDKLRDLAVDAAPERSGDLKRSVFTSVEG